MNKDESFVPKDTEETAEFNSAFAYLERLNKIEYMIEDALMNWNLPHCFYVLESYENELNFCFKKGDEEKVNEIKLQITKILNECPNIGKMGKNINGTKYIIGGSMTGTLRSLLIKLNKTLRQIKHKGGMGMPSKGEGKLF